MARSVNKAIIVGNLGQDPERRVTQAGTPVATISVATNEQWTDKRGEKQERTEWHRCVLWDKLADVAAKYLTKGDRVYVEGKIQTRKWDDKEGVTRYSTEIVVRDLVMLGGQAEGGGRRPSGRAESLPEEEFAEFSNEALSGPEDDLPF
jgi:single-strand DNA-binding protein